MNFQELIKAILVDPTSQNLCSLSSANRYDGLRMDHMDESICRDMYMFYISIYIYICVCVCVCVCVCDLKVGKKASRLRSKNINCNLSVYYKLNKMAGLYICIIMVNFVINTAFDENRTLGYIRHDLTQTSCRACFP